MNDNFIFVINVTIFLVRRKNSLHDLKTFISFLNCLTEHPKTNLKFGEKHNEN